MGFLLSMGLNWLQSISFDVLSMGLNGSVGVGVLSFFYSGETLDIKMPLYVINMNNTRNHEQNPPSPLGTINSQNERLNQRI